MNVLNSAHVRECTSCQMCAAVCPTSAISIHLDSQGFYRPMIDVDKCIDCSLCTKFCYKYNDVEETSLEDLKKYSLYAAYTTDKELLKTSTSGGVASILAKRLYDEGYICIGVSYDSQKDIAYHKVARSEVDIRSFRGSKYIQSYSFDAFKEFVNMINREDKIAVFGSPCQIYALDCFLRFKKKRDHVLLVDFYCHGCPSLLAWKPYIENVKNEIGAENVEEVRFRSKAKGWGQFCIETLADSHRTYLSNKRNDPFFTLFFSNFLLNDSCSDCQLRSTLKYTDIRVGDFWGDQYDTNMTGISAVTIVTENGHEALKKIKTSLNLKEHLFSDFLPFQSWNIEYPVDLICRNKMFAYLRRGDLDGAVHVFYKSQTIVQQLKRHLKNFISLFPTGVVNRIKYLYHKL